VVWQDGRQVRLPSLAPSGGGGASAVTERGQVAGSTMAQGQSGTEHSVAAMWTCHQG
jgi:hypothetical protein